MYSFGPEHRRALARVSAPLRLAIERWVELTHDDTHPYWRCHPASGDVSTLYKDLEIAIADGNLDAIPSSTTAVVAALLHRGYVRSWQHGAVQKYVIDPAAEHAGTPIQERFRNVALAVTTSPPEERTVQLSWVIGAGMPASFLLPWRNPVFTIPDTERTFSVVERGKGRDRRWLIATEVDVDTARGISRAATELRADASPVIDILRSTYGDPQYFRSGDVEVSGSSLLSFVRPRPIPRVRSRRRARRSVGNLLKLLAFNPKSPLTNRLLGACRWMSTAVARWEETPVFATSLLWMSLEAIFGKCVIDHHKECRRRDHSTAVDAYVNRLHTTLADEVEEYLLALRGTEHSWKKGWRTPPEWARAWVSRGEQPIGGWLTSILTRIPADDHSEPLLQLRCTELLEEASIARTARADVARDLRRLKKMRNAVAHEGDPQLKDEEADYLAAVAIEILYSVFDTASITVGGEKPA